MAQRRVPYINLNDLVEGFLTWRFMVRERVPFGGNSFMVFKGIMAVVFVVFLRVLMVKMGNKSISNLVFCSAVDDDQVS